MSRQNQSIMHKLPVPRNAEATVLEWAEELAAHFRCSAQDLRANSAMIQFPDETVRVELMDESVVEFKHALYIVSKEKKAIAVFSEHCGHHVLPFHEAKVFVDGQARYVQE